MNPKRIYRTEDGDATLFGVCGGLAEYFNIDPTIVRLLMVALFFCGSLSLWVYIIAALVIPKKSNL